MEDGPAFWGKYPLAWVAFAALVLAIPLVAMARPSAAGLVAALPTLNASLNATSAIFLFAGWRAIRADRAGVHWRCMLAAAGASVLFLASYITRFALTGAHRYPVPGWSRSVYLVVLGSHTLLATTVPFLAARTLYLAARKRFPSHRRIARWTFPVWMYVSVTGVLVYLMLYHLAPALQP